MVNIAVLYQYKIQPKKFNSIGLQFVQRRVSRRRPRFRRLPQDPRPEGVFRCRTGTVVRRRVRAHRFRADKELHLRRKVLRRHLPGLYFFKMDLYRPLFLFWSFQQLTVTSVTRKNRQMSTKVAQK